MNKPLIIIPAAGYGRRMGLIHQSKEMLPSKSHPHLIDLALGEATKLQWPVHVVTRKEKLDLTQYLTQSQVSTQFVDPTREWPQTILLSEPHWSEWNMIFLPDMEYSPLNILEDIWSQIQKASDDSAFNLAAAVFSSPDLSHWGAIKKSRDGFEFAEKPIHCGSGLAWGFLFFKKSIGRELFQNLLASSCDHQWKFLKASGFFVTLEKFADLTRAPSARWVET